VETLQADILTLKELINRELREDEIIDLSPKVKKPKPEEPSTRREEKKPEPPEQTLSLF
jgi:hypothetical protein